MFAATTVHLVRYAVLFVLVSECALSRGEPSTDTPPSGVTGFSPILAKAVLVGPTEDETTKSLVNFQTTHFYTGANKDNVHFSMNGVNRLSELRQVGPTSRFAKPSRRFTTRKYDRLATLRAGRRSSKMTTRWDIKDDYNIVEADVMIPKPSSAFSKFTFISAMHGHQVAVGITWRKRWSVHNDAIVAEIRHDAHPHDVNYYYLGPRTDNFEEYDVMVKENKVSIWYRGDGRVLDQSVLYYSGKDVVFQAGISIDESSDPSATATSQFSYLDWFNGSD